MLLAFLLCFRLFHARNKRLRRRTILSFSPVTGITHLSTGPSINVNVTPYPFESKAWDDSQPGPADVEPTPSLRKVPGRRVPSFYHVGPGAGAGIASTQPTRQGHELNANANFDTFNCAMYPAGTCPLEHEERMRSLHDSGGGGRNRSSSPVPSFQTDRLAQQPVITGLGRQLTPPKRAAAPAPAPLVFSPSIDQWTNSVRGFTPRASASQSSGASSIYSLYVPDRV